MKIELPQKLKILSVLFTLNGTPLYVVGGYVRNAMLGIGGTDIDLAASLSADEVIKLIEGTDFFARVQSKKLGTLKLYSRDKELACEYTAFRVEEYEEGGSHTPVRVSFRADIKTDASRRDFTCNAMYYHIQKNKLVDFFGAPKHTKERTIKMVHNKVFESDGLRILRMIRQSAELNFKIDRETYDKAIKNIELLKDITAERKRKELELMLSADTKYKTGNHMIAIDHLYKTGAINYLMPNMEHSKPSFKLLRLAEPKARLCAFAIDMGLKSEDIQKHFGENGLKMSARTISTAELVLDAYYQLKDNVVVALDTRKFIQKYSSVLDILLALKYKSRQLAMAYQYMKSKKIPLTLSDLAINGLEVLSEFPILKGQKIGQTLQMLLEYTAESPSVNKYNLLIEKIKKELRSGKL